MSSKQHKDYDFLLYRIESLERRLDNMKSTSNESELLQLVLKLIENKNVTAPAPAQTICTTTISHEELKKAEEDKYDSLTFARRRTMT